MSLINRMCNVNNIEKVALKGSSIKELKKICNDLGGGLVPFTQILDLKCENMPEDHVLLTLPGSGDVTCKNYKEIFSDTEDGDYVINHGAFRETVGNNIQFDHDEL